MKKLLLLLLLLFAAAPVTLRGEIKLPALFGDNMVLQQQRLVRIWGQADTPEVFITPSWTRETVRAEVREGCWVAEIPTPRGTSSPQSLLLRDSDSERVLRNILIGEVWLCSGQSNMFMPLKGFSGQPVEDSFQTVLRSTRYGDRIRMFTAAKRASAAPCRDCAGAWAVPSPETAPKMSAAAYFFAQALTDALGVPVGIVSVSWGGSKIEAWLDPASLRAEGYRVETINADPGISVKEKCSMLYNGMIAPAAGFAARGFVWYQGESNRGEADRYARLMQRLAALWRERWGDERGEMPFLYVQIAPYAYRDAAGMDAALLVEAQSDAGKLIPNSAMVSTTDLGEEHCIHPARKRPVGERLAAEALTRAYGLRIADGSAVRFRSAEFAGGRAYVAFDNARGGLTPRDAPVTGFELAGPDGVFHPAVGRVVGSRPVVEVSAPEVPDPCAVRYAFRNFLPGNLRNTMQLPAIPFRSDR